MKIDENVKPDYAIGRGQHSKREEIYGFPPASTARLQSNQIAGADEEAREACSVF
jgi:hypothetical protein